MPFLAALKHLAIEARESRALKACFWVGAALVVLNLALYLIKLSPFIGKPDLLAVHYSVQIGIDRLAPWYWTLPAPLLALGVFFIDGYFALRLRHAGRRELAILVAVFADFLLALFLAGTVILVLLNVGV